VKREYKNVGDRCKSSPQFNQTIILRGFLNKFKREKSFLGPLELKSFLPEMRLKGRLPSNQEGEGEAGDRNVVLRG
jgi:hypothetical protein